MIDTHAHYDHEHFDADREAVLEYVFKSGVSHVINTGCDMNSSRASLALAKAYKGMYAAVGVHPHDAAAWMETDFEELEALSVHPKVIAIGEIGLDYHYDFSPRDKQKEVFKKQIRLALKVRKPVILHDREAHKDIMDIVKEEKAYEVGGVFHCWSGSREMAEVAVKMGFYIGIGGSVTFKKAHRIQEVAAWVPFDRLLIETDCPYMTPEPFRGQRNKSDYMMHIVEKLATLRGTTKEAIESQTGKNAIRLFGLST